MNINLEKNYKAYLILLTVFSLFLHLIYVDYSRFEHEMVRDITIAEKILKGEPIMHGLLGSLKEDAAQQSFGPLYYYLIAFSLLFTNSIYYYSLMPYILTIILHLLSLIVLFKLCKEFFNLKVAFIASSLYTFSPWIFIHVASIFTNSNFPVLFVIFFIYSMFKFLIKDENKYLVYGMVSLSLATQFHLASLTLFPVFICYLFLKKKFKVKYFMHGAILSFLLFLPFLYHNIVSGNIGSVFAFLTQRYESSFFNTLVEAIGMPVLYLTPYFSRYLLGNISFGTAINIFVIMFTIFMSLLFFLAILQLVKLFFKNEDMKAKILIIWIAIPVLLYIISSKDLSPHYLNIILPSQFIIISLYINKLANSSKIMRFLPYLLIFANILFIMLFYNLVSENNGTSGIFGVPYKIKYELINFIKEDSYDASLIVNYYKGNKRDLNFLFDKIGLSANANVIDSLDEYNEGYLILDRFSYYSYDKSIPKEQVEKLGVPRRIGNFEIYKK